MPKHVAKTPKRITPDILAFCQDLGGTTPVYVVLSPHAPVGRCFDNAEREAGSNGGVVVYGWSIWEYTDVYMTAEYHAIVERDGSYIDTTRQMDGSVRILFLPEPGATRPDAPVINRYRPIENHPLLIRCVELQVSNLRLFYAGKANTMQFRTQDAEACACLERFIERKQDKDKRKKLKKR